MHFTLKTKHMTRVDLDDFVSSARCRVQQVPRTDGKQISHMIC